jgi:hypothetical protein
MEGRRNTPSFMTKIAGGPSDGHPWLRHDAAQGHGDDVDIQIQSGIAHKEQSTRLSGAPHPDTTPWWIEGRSVYHPGQIVDAQMSRFPARPGRIETSKAQKPRVCRGGDGQASYRETQKEQILQGWSRLEGFTVGNTPW